MHYPLKNYRPLTLMIVLALLGCGRSQSEDGSAAFTTSDRASSPPSKERLLSVLAPAYSSEPGARQECLGRLMFDIRQPIQWSTNFNKFGNLFNGNFSTNVFDRGDMIEVGDTKIDVLGPVDSAAINEILGTTPGALLREIEKGLALSNSLIAEMLKKHPRSEQDQRLLAEFQETKASREKTVEELRAEHESFDTGLPNTEAYWTTRTTELSSSNSVYLAYMVRGDYVFVFESGVQLSPTLDRETHKRQFLKLLSDFRPR